MKNINTETISVTGSVSFLAITSTNIQEQIGEHATAQLTGYISDEIGIEELNGKLHRASVTLTYNKTDEVLFSGVVADFDISIENDVYFGTLKLISHTTLLDQDYHSRSFQDLGMTYRELVNKVLDEAGFGMFVSSVNNTEEPIPYPIIQYHETDWAFIKRMASHFNASLFPHFKYGEPEFYIGLPVSQKEFDFGKHFKACGVSNRFYLHGGRQSNYNQEDFFYYKVSSKENLMIGDTGLVDGNSLQIVEKQTLFVNFEVVYEYVLASEIYADSKMMNNEIFSGLTILGTVIETEKETLKIHLDIDDKQDVGTAYSYPWMPSSGNLMYLMPQVGTRVSLYFSNQCESTGKAVGCVRTNGDSEMMSDPSQRRLLTEHGKQMHLYPESMGFTSAREGTPLTMMFDDTEGVIFSSHNKLDIFAVESIMIEAPIVTLSALSQIQAVKADIAITGGGDIPYNVIADPIAYLDLFDLTQIQGERTHYTTWIFYPFDPFEDAPVKGKFQQWAMVGKILAGIAVVVIVTAVIVVTAGAAAAAIPALTTVALGAAPVLTTGGTLIVSAIGAGTATYGLNAVKNMAEDEYYNNNYHSTFDYMNYAGTVTYQTGSFLSLPLNIWSLSHTLPATLKSLGELGKWILGGGITVTPPSIGWVQNAVTGGLAPLFNPGAITTAGAIPQVVASAEAIASALGIVAFAGSGSFEKNRGGKGNTPNNNQVQNRSFNDVVKKAKPPLSKKEARMLHDEITGQGYGYQEMLEIAESMFPGRY